MASLAKARSLAQQLKSNLSMRMPSLTISQTDDSSGSKLLISDGTPAAGEQVMAIRIRGVDSQFSNSIGQQQESFSPHVVQVIEEESTVADVSLLTLSNQVKLSWEVGRLGCMVERWMNANATVPALSQFQADGSVSGSSLKERISDLQHPLSGQ